MRIDFRCLVVLGIGASAIFCGGALPPTRQAVQLPEPQSPSFTNVQANYRQILLVYRLTPLHGQGPGVEKCYFKPNLLSIAAEERHISAHPNDIYSILQFIYLNPLIGSVKLKEFVVTMEKRNPGSLDWRLDSLVIFRGELSPFFQNFRTTGVRPGDLNKLLAMPSFSKIDPEQYALLSPNMLDLNYSGLGPRRWARFSSVCQSSLGAQVCLLCDWYFAYLDKDAYEDPISSKARRYISKFCRLASRRIYHLLPSCQNPVQIINACGQLQYRGYYTRTQLRPQVHRALILLHRWPRNYHLSFRLRGYLKKLQS